MVSLLEPLERTPSQAVSRPQGEGNAHISAAQQFPKFLGSRIVNFSQTSEVPGIGVVINHDLIGGVI